MRKILSILLILGFLAACKGPITGHDYTKEEILKDLKFVGESAKRIDKYRKGNFTSEDIKVSKQRLKKAIEYLDNLKKEAKRKDK